MSRPTFEIAGRDGRARRGRLHFARGTVDTPAFMPVGTAAAVKAVTPGELAACGAQIILSNTYHLYLRPGHELIRELGGLHAFMRWPGPILTDSGGFQVLSMEGLRRVEERGVQFRSHLDGSSHLLTPELAMQVQAALGSDVAMVLDICPALPAPRQEVEQAVERTTRWARRSVAAYDGPGVVFGIIQGGTFPDLRERSAHDLLQLDLAGYAVGGVSVGESPEAIRTVMEISADLLPDNRPRYLMGVGQPADLVDAVARGFDMFDCVLPTRNARNGTLYTSEGKFNIKRAEFRNDRGPLDATCACETCRTFSRAYLRHLFVSGEILSSRLHTIHNLTYYLRLMDRVREAISAGSLEALRREIHALPVRGAEPA